MSAKQLIRALRRYYHIILCSLITAGAIAYVLSSRSAPLYTSSAKVQISQPLKSVSQPSYDILLFNERLAKTYVELMHAHPLLDEVIAHLNLNTNSITLDKAIEITPIRDTSLLQITVKYPDPQGAADIVNEIVHAFNEEQSTAWQERVKIVQNQINTDLKQLQGDIDRIQLQIQQNKATNSNADTSQLEELLVQNRNTYSAHIEQLAQLHDIDDTGSAQILQMIEPATLGTTSAQSQIILKVMLAAIFGTLLAIGAVTLVEYTNDTIYTREDAEALTGTSVMTIIPRLPSELSEQLVTATQPQSQAADAFRSLWIQSEARLGKPTRSMLITSVEAQSGKSVCIANIAMLLAQMGKQVILVDTNLRNPTLHTLLRQENTVGLTTALQQSDQPIEDYLVATHKPNLMFLPSGPTCSAGIDLLGSQRFTKIVTQLQQLADVVLFDTPALTTAIDAAMIHLLCDDTLLVAQVGTTSTAAFQRAKEQLIGRGSQTIGLVLIDKSLRTPDLAHAKGGLRQRVYATWKSLWPQI